MGYHIYTQRQEEMENKRKRWGVGWGRGGGNALGRLRLLKFWVA